MSTHAKLKLLRFSASLDSYIQMTVQMMSIQMSLRQAPSVGLRGRWTFATPWGLRVDL